MDEIPEQSVDMVLCDLPYGTTANKWDISINLQRLWKQYNRIITTNGAIVLFASQPFTSKLIGSNYDMFRYTWTWIKDNGTGFINAHCQPIRLSEDICIFSKAKAIPNAKIRMTYHPQGLVPYNKMVRRGSAGSNYNTINNQNYQTYSNYPTNLLYFCRDKYKAHPTQKPVALCEYLINTYSKIGDKVLDNCMGSGTTGVACLNTGRRFVGIELDTTYCDIATARIQDVVSKSS